MHDHPSDDQLLEYAEALDGELRCSTPVEEHLCSCDPCRRRLEELLSSFTFASLSLTRWAELDPQSPIEEVADPVQARDHEAEHQLRHTPLSGNPTSTACRSPNMFSSVIASPYGSRVIFGVVLLAVAAWSFTRNTASKFMAFDSRFTTAGTIDIDAPKLPSTIANPEEREDNLVPELRLHEMRSISFVTTTTKASASRLQEDGLTIFRYDSDVFKRTVLNKLDERDQLKVYQALLARMELYDGEIDGLFGKRTSEAVCRFQRRCNQHGGEPLVEDGYLGPHTQARLLEQLPPIVRAGQSTL